MTFRILLLVTLLAPMSAASAADIGVSPPHLALTIPIGGTIATSFHVIWTGSGAVDLALATSDWAMSAKGQVQFLPIGQGDHSASNWIDASANSVHVQANSEALVRLKIHVPDDRTLSGTYRSVVFVETPSTPPEGAQARITTRQRVGVIVYVTIAGTQKNGSELTDMYADGPTVHAIVSNLGNTVMRYSGSIEVRDASGTTVRTISVDSSAILRETERDIAVKLPELPKGYYVLLLLLKDSRGGLLTGQLPYEVK